MKTAECVSLGHPDKIADYISCYLLDKCIEQDENVKFAVEVMIKDNVVVLGGELKGDVDINPYKYVYEALHEIGYTEEYSKVWKDNAIEINKLKIINLIGQQSSEINQGVITGWGDQGVFVGYATNENTDFFLPEELVIAKYLCNELYELAKSNYNHYGLDIKTQITLNGDIIEHCVVAIPTMECNNRVKKIVTQILKGYTINKITINGTGKYIQHSSIADCGITGRKLAVDFYSTASPIGGGSPWTKDPSKADLSLNLYARKLAVEVLASGNYDECFVYLSSCIGKSDMISAVAKCIRNSKSELIELELEVDPITVLKTLGLKNPIYRKLCRDGLFSMEHHPLQ